MKSHFSSISVVKETFRVIHCSVPSIPRRTTEVKRLIAQEVSVCHFVSQTPLVTLGTISPILCSVWSVFSAEAAETPFIHTDIREASNGRR